MNRRLILVLTAAGALLAPLASHAALTSYTGTFETLVQTDAAALQNDGWVVYGNVFSPDHSTYYYGYGPFPAPNPGPGFCAIDAGQGGPQQGAQQLSVYSDYNNADHANGNLVESNVYREQTVAAGDVGTRWIFQFDAKLGNLVSPSTALAFIKTLNPAAGYATTNFITVNTTAIPANWNTYTASIFIDASLVGQLLQIGFANTATHYDASGVFYDNIVFSRETVGAPGAPRAGGVSLGAAAPNPFTSGTRIEYALPATGTANLDVYDVVGRHVATLHRGVATAGTHTATWDGRTDEGPLAPTGVYQCVLQTDLGRQSRRLVLGR